MIFELSYEALLRVKDQLMPIYITLSVCRLCVCLTLRRDLHHFVILQ